MKLSDSSIQIGVFSAFIVISISYAFHFYSNVFLSFYVQHFELPLVWNVLIQINLPCPDLPCLRLFHCNFKTTVRTLSYHISHTCTSISWNQNKIYDIIYQKYSLVDQFMLKLFMILNRWKHDHARHLLIKHNQFKNVYVQVLNVLAIGAFT